MKIDSSGRKRLFLFTGSYVPSDRSAIHTGTGRFAPLRMRTMSLFETGDSNGTVSLSELFSGTEMKTVKSSLDYGKAIRLMCKGGWPGELDMSGEDAVEISKAYINLVANSDASCVDGKKRSPEKVEKLIISLARNTATYASLDTIASDMAGKGNKKPGENTVRDYLGALRKLFLVEEQRGWSPNLRSTVRTQSSPKRHLTDPSLAAAAVYNGPGELEQDLNMAGFLFESL
ncbi:MAG: DUF4143 domain-containing protein [Candidatus Methanoplasma sp.]|jgi:predicted AAA+ superfamily ATPase|nr:DUF4143 domain-containing protein [Candidatus Methanoplasma sp.]